MEAEMDATLEQKQSLIKDLRAKLNMLEKENDSLKVSQQKGVTLPSNVTNLLVVV